MAIATAVVAIDQITKSLAEGERFTAPGVHLFGDVRLARTYNEGVAFGLGGGAAPMLIGVAILGFALVVFKRQLPINRWVIAGMGLVVGGGLGNLADRIFRNHDGAVVDFIDVGVLPLINYSWPVFNVADMCVVSGAVILAIFGSTAPKSTELDEPRESQ